MLWLGVLTCLGAAAADEKKAAAAGGPEPLGRLRRDGASQHRPLPRRPRGRGHGRARPAARLLPRRHGRRRLEDGRRRVQLAAGLRQGLQDGLRRRDRRGRVGPQRDLRRDGGIGHPRQRLQRRRRLQVDRRRKDVDQRRPREHAPDLARARAPEGREPRLRGGAGPRVGAQPRAGHLPVEGRRQDVGEDPLRLRSHGGLGPVHGPDRTRGSSTPAFWQVCAQALGARLPEGRRAASTSRPTAATRGRSSREACRRGPSATSASPCLPARPERVWAIVEAEKGGVYRSEDGGEKWTRVNSENKLRQRAWYYSKIYADPKNADAVYVLNTGLLSLQRRGRDVRGDPGSARRQPRPLDRPGRSGAHDRGQRRRRDRDVQRREDLVFADEPADGAVLSGHDRRPLPLPRLRRAAGQLDRRHREPRPAAASIGVTDWYDVGGGESGWIAPMPGNPDVVFAGSYGGEITRYDHKTGELRQIVAWPQLAIGQAPKDLKYRFQWNAPILISRHDPKTMYHARAGAARQPRRGAVLAGDLPGPDAQRPVEAGEVRRPDHQGRHRRRGLRHDLRARRVARGAGCALGGHGRRARARDARRRQALGQRDAQGAARVDPDQRDRGFAARSGERVTSRPRCTSSTTSGRTSTRRTTTARPGRRSRTASPPSSSRASSARTPCRKGLLYAGTEYGLFVSFDDGAKLGAVPAQSARRADHRPRGQGGRSRRGHPGAFLLDPRRPDAAARLQERPARRAAPRLPAAPVRTASGRAAGAATTKRAGRPTTGRTLPAASLVSYWLARQARGEGDADDRDRSRATASCAPTRARRRTRTRKRTARARTRIRGPTSRSSPRRD